MVDCPDCERYKASASMWRNEAYRVAGHPLPWSPDMHLLKRALDALDTAQDYALDATEEFHRNMAGYKQHRHDAMDADVKEIADTIAALRARLEGKL